MKYAEAKKAWDAAKDREKARRAEFDAASAEYGAALDQYITLREKAAARKENKALFESLKDREKAASDALTLARIETAIYRDNARRALLDEIKPAALQILAKYAGKPYGEKTRAKIAEEIKTATGLRAYLSQNSYRAELNFYPDQYTFPFRADDLQFSFYAASGDREPILLENKINLTDADALRAYCYTEIIEDPAARADEIISAYHAAEEAAKAWEAAASQFNALAPLTVVKHMNFYDGRPARLID